MPHEEKWKKLHDKYRRAAFRIGLGEHADDLAQEAMVRVAENPKAEFQPPKFAIIDAARRLGWGNRGGVCRDVLRLRPVVAEGCDELERVMPDGPTPRLDFEILERAVQDLPERERVCLLLRHAWEFDLSEIGKLFGFSESRASQIIAAAERRTKKEYLKMTDLVMPKIEKNVPIPARSKPQDPVVAHLISVMVVADCVIVENAIAKRLAASTKKLGWKFALRKHSETETRVWRRL